MKEAGEAGLPESMKTGKSLTTGAEAGVTGRLFWK